MKLIWINYISNMEKWINLDMFISLPIFNDTARVMHKLLALAIKEEKWKVYLNSNVRKDILKSCKVSKASCNRAIKQLEECGFLMNDKDILILNLPTDFSKVIFKN